MITGAASGIGLALAQVFAREGMNLVLADIEGEALERAQAQLASTGAEMLAMVTDVSRAEDLQRLANRSLVQFGDTHILCNNAGVFTGGQLWECSLADYHWLMNVNVWGPVHGIRSFLPAMIRHGEPCHIVNTSSMAGLTAMPFAGIYHMTKHAVMGLSESLYKEMMAVAPHVGVSVLCPELIKTGIFRSQRNRPEDFSAPGDITTGETVAALHTSAVESGDNHGIDPAIIAERTLAAIRDQQFYILPNEEWRRIAHIRLDEIRAGSNPSLVVPQQDSNFDLPSSGN